MRQSLGSICAWPLSIFPTSSNLLLSPGQRGVRARSVRGKGEAARRDPDEKLRTRITDWGDYSYRSKESLKFFLSVSTGHPACSSRRVMMPIQQIRSRDKSPNYSSPKDERIKLLTGLKVFMCRFAGLQEGYNDADESKLGQGVRFCAAACFLFAVSLLCLRTQAQVSAAKLSGTFQSS